MDVLVSRRRLLQAGVAVGATLSFGAGLRFDPAAPHARVLSIEELVVVQAAAEALFPGAPMPLDGIEAGVAEEVDRLLVDLLVEPHTSAFRLVLRALEWGTLASRGVRFARLSVDDRREVIDAWSDPAVLPRRAALDYLRLILGTAYFNNPVIREATGWRVGCEMGERT